MAVLTKQSACALGLIFNEDRTEVLLVKRRDIPIWVIPGGGIDPGESPEEAAEREVWEESGYGVELTRKAACYTPTGPLTAIVHIYEGIVKNGKATLSDESCEVAFFPLNALPKDLFCIHREWINDVAAHPTVMIEREQTSVSAWRLIKTYIIRPGIAVSYVWSQIKMWWRK